ncbi:hypothetical protein GCM10020295_11280 [Streptomyces cinereospinus]
MGTEGLPPQFPAAAQPTGSSVLIESVDGRPHLRDIRPKRRTTALGSAGVPVAAGSRPITEKDAGSHGVTNLVNPCVNDRVDAYLLTGELDAADVACAPHAPPEP